MDAAPPTGPAPESRGYVFAATGPDYTALAARAATILQRVVGSIPIDLFTDQFLGQFSCQLSGELSDQPAPDNPFDEIHALGDGFFRPKFEALIRSRFARTIYLDADIWAVADPSDIFDLLDRFDVALAHDPYRATEHATAPWRQAIPAAFPQYNSGVIGARCNPATHAAWQAVIDGIRQGGAPRDQGVLREVLWTGGMRIATLPEEYNLMGLRALNVLSSDCTAPRLIHSPRLHAVFRKGRAPVDTLGDLLGRNAAAQVTRLVAADPTLGGSGVRVRPLIRRGLMELLSRPLGLVRGRFER